MMRASVKSDRATRVIEMDLETDGAGWDMHDVIATWRAKPRTFRPDEVHLVLLQGESGWEPSSIRVSGQLVLKSGAVSPAQQSRDAMTWRKSTYWEAERIDHAPEWVQEIARQAPGGITGFIWTDSERAEEVQPL